MGVREGGMGGSAGRVGGFETTRGTGAVGARVLASFGFCGFFFRILKDGLYVFEESYPSRDSKIKSSVFMSFCFIVSFNNSKSLCASFSGAEESAI